MIRITFEKARGGIYWAVCESLSRYDKLNGYDLDSVLEDSTGTAPACKITIPADWRMLSIQEV